MSVKQYAIMHITVRCFVGNQLTITFYLTTTNDGNLGIPMSFYLYHFTLCNNFDTISLLQFKSFRVAFQHVDTLSLSLVSNSQFIIRPKTW